METKQQKAHIFIVDDSGVLRLGLKTLIDFENDMMVTGEAATSQEALQKLNGNCDLAVVDIALVDSDLDGIALTEEIKRRHPSLPVLVFSMHQEEIYAERALRAGSSGYIMKHEASEHLIEAIRKILCGGTFWSPELRKNR
jgi:DNA-binding NarL/FixJ family response regulator